MSPLNSRYHSINKGTHRSKTQRTSYRDRQTHENRKAGQIKD